MPRNQIIGGNYKNPDGTPVSNGSLLLELTQDANINAICQLGGKSVVTIPLDNSGNVSGTVLIWPNDLMTPSGVKYIYRVYNSSGLLVSGPALMTILSSPSPFILP